MLDAAIEAHRGHRMGASDISQADLMEADPPTTDPFVSEPSKAMGSSEAATEDRKVAVWNRWAQLALQACQDDWEQAVKDV
ncbi:MAG: hypothetical protein AAB113_07275, partial [Candidatus Eisenbacteria bacterium]